MSGSRTAIPLHFLQRTLMLPTPLRCSSKSLGAFSAIFLSSALDPTKVRVPQSSHVQTGSGTPQYLWRDMTQSRAPLSPSLKRFDPAHSGTQVTRLFSLSICFLNEVTRRNHCSVALRISGVLQRHQ